MTKTKVALSIDSDVLESVKLLAKVDSRSLSAYVNKVLSDHIREGLAAPDPRDIPSKRAPEKPTKGKVSR